MMLENDREKFNKYGNQLSLYGPEISPLSRREIISVYSNARRASRVIRRLAWLDRYFEHIKTYGNTNI